MGSDETERKTKGSVRRLEDVLNKAEAELGEIQDFAMDLQFKREYITKSTRNSIECLPSLADSLTLKYGHLRLEFNDTYIGKVKGNLKIFNDEGQLILAFTSPYKLILALCYAVYPSEPKFNVEYYNPNANGVSELRDDVAKWKNEKKKASDEKLLTQEQLNLLYSRRDALKLYIPASLEPFLL